MRRLLCYVSVLLVTVTSSVNVIAASQPSFYLRYDDEQAVLSDAINSAEQTSTLVALVLGAEWCHDSRALADFMQSQTLATPLQDIELVPLDVGFLENKNALRTPLDYPAYFATPTLLLIDPTTQQVVNRDSLVRWQSAHNEPAEALAEYLREQLHHWQQHGSPKLPAAAVSAFEQAQAKTLYQHYSKLGTLLNLETQGKPVPTLNEKWLNVKAYRTRLQQDLIDMHKQGSIGDNLPTYAPISW